MNGRCKPPASGWRCGRSSPLWRADPGGERQPRQFHQSCFVPQVLAALARTGAEGSHLKLEMTEGLLLADVEDTIAKMATLRSYGWASR